MPMPFLAPGDLHSAGLPEEAISLSNPLVHEESLLRTSLLPGQLKIVSYNQSHRVEDLRFFEIGHIFLPENSNGVLPDEREYLSVALVNVEVAEVVDILHLLENELSIPNLQLIPKAFGGLHPGRSSEVRIAGQGCGQIGEVDPRVAQSYEVTGRVAWFELDLGKILSGPLGNSKYKRVSKYPSSDIDLAFDVPPLASSDTILGCLKKAGTELLVSVKLFDSYSGESISDGRRSLAYSLRFQAPDRTLTDDEISELRSQCIQLVEKRTEARLRN
jgi:phenylalanyl-tRNA synthetase beta chain